MTDQPLLGYPANAKDCHLDMSRPPLVRNKPQPVLIFMRVGQREKKNTNIFGLMRLAGFNALQLSNTAYNPLHLTPFRVV
jgi:hypothetical protein